MASNGAKAAAVVGGLLGAAWLVDRAFSRATDLGAASRIPPDRRKLQSDIRRALTSWDRARAKFEQARDEFWDAENVPHEAMPEDFEPRGDDRSLPALMSQNGPIIETQDGLVWLNENWEFASEFGPNDDNDSWATLPARLKPVVDARVAMDKKGDKVNGLLEEWKSRFQRQPATDEDER